MIILKPSKESLEKSVEMIRKGCIIICPTDTVYGFLADATNKKAVEKIYKIKKRQKYKPLPVFIKDFKMAKDLAEIDEKQEKLIKKKWPGKYTFILELKSQISKRKTTTQKPKLYGMKKDGTIAIRLPKHKFLNDLLKKINRPLVQTSVNISGEKSLTYIKDITDEFQKDRRITLIIDGGNIRNAKSSKIIDLTKEKLTILR